MKWKIYRIVCILQMLASSIFAIIALIDFLRHANVGDFMRFVLFTSMFLLTILATNILNTNYPDVPVTGRQKTNFNRLFLLNFLFLVFLFGIIFADYRQLAALAELLARPILKLPIELFGSLIINLAILAFQLYILYGLYELRRELYFNFRRKEFEFERGQAL
ncbi:MAG: hypothetical protein H7Y42_13150 [Chitinophagaceae bacterium]|nr:hypothetical protein [Chitinophagaceae bacterium]